MSNLTLHRYGRALTTALLLASLAGCSSAPPPPDWKMNAVSQLEHFQARWLEGDSKAADLALDKSRAEIAKTGRLDLLAKLELAACGTRVAALDFTPCADFQNVSAEAAAAEQVYARFLAGQWAGLDAKLLPPHYAGVISAKEDHAANLAIQGIKDPLAQLIATGLLFKQGRATPASLATAIDTASERGWRRPLLTWLEVERTRSRTVGDLPRAEAMQRRIDFMLSPSSR